jgi:diguanylate cyclase (GGDEF)-like protein
VLVDLEKVDRALAGLPREAGSPSLLAMVDRLLSPHAEELAALAGSIAHTRLQLQDRDIATMIDLVGLNRTMLLVFFGVAGCFTLVLSVEAVAARRAEAEARAGECRMRHMAEHDSLTDLANRNHFHAVMTDRLADSATSAALLLVDIDGFNEINDVFGHAEGDAALVEVGKSLRTLAGGSELIARLGGDEFALLLNGDAGAALTRAKAVTERFGAPIETARRSHRLDASIGVALAPIDGQTSEALLKAADLALYAAKARGHGQIARFTAEIGDAFVRRKTIEAALETGAFVAGLTLVFQPQVELATGRPVGAEALMRYVDHLALGAIRPDEFVAVAEQTGHIVALDEHILEEGPRPTGHRARNDDDGTRDRLADDRRGHRDRIASQAARRLRLPAGARLPVLARLGIGRAAAIRRTPSLDRARAVCLKELHGDGDLSPISTRCRM